jgi:hypothetical protein
MHRWKQQVQEALDSGSPIPVDAFLASWSETAALVALPDPSPALVAKLAAAASAWRDAAVGPRPDLAGISAKSLATKLAAEIRAHVNYSVGVVSGASDLEHLNIEILTTRSSRPQAGLKQTSPSQKALGLGTSLLIVVYDLDETSLIVHEVKLIPSSATSDSNASKLAEALRVDVVRRYKTLPEALAKLSAEGVSPDVAMISALTSDLPILQGSLRLTSAAEWRIRLTNSSEAVDLLAPVSYNSDDTESFAVKGQAVLAFD